MANIVIVTSECYMLAESINYIVVNEVEDEWKSSTRKKGSTVKAQREWFNEQKPFNIVIDFVAKGGAQSAVKSSLSRPANENSTISIKILGLRRTLKVFRDIVNQLREQIPDELFLDKLVERFLCDTSTEDAAIKKMGLK